MVKIRWVGAEELKNVFIEESKKYTDLAYEFVMFGENVVITDSMDVKADDFRKVVYVTDNFVSVDARRMMFHGCLIYSTEVPIEHLFEFVFNNFKYHPVADKVEDIVDNYNQTKVITGTSLNGGTGVTTIVVNSALLRAKTKKVILIDFTQFGDATALLGNFKTEVGLDPLVSYMNENLIELEKLESLVSRNIQTYTKDGVSLHYLSSPEFSKYDSITKDMVAELINVLRKMSYDFIYIDTGKNFNVLNMSLLSISDLVMFVMVPTVTMAVNLMKFNQLMSLLSLRKKSIVIMNKYYKNTPISNKDLENQINIPVRLTIGNIRNLKQDTTNISNTKLTSRLESMIRGYSL